MDRTPVDWSTCLDNALLSDVGMRRANNQDSSAVFLAPDIDAWRRRGHVFVVADGMGAHAAGELASKMATDGIPHTYHKLADQPPPYAIAKAIEEVNTAINQRGQANIDFQGMGTTSSVLLLLPQGALVAHVGDSRVYRLRGDRLEQLTFDHSLIWEMRATGELDPDALSTFVPKSIITRSLGPHPHVQIDLEGPYPLEVGDTFLLCSDGLTGQVRDEEIGAILTCFSPKEAAQTLVDLANLRGGPDNITVIIARVTSPQIATGSEPLAVKAGDLSVARRVPKPLWFAGPVLWVVAGALFWLGYREWALGAVFFGALALTIAVVRRFGAAAGIFYLRAGTRLGKGPHVTADAAPNQVIVDSLALLVDQLRDAATGERWTIDADRFNQLIQHGRAASQRGDYREAVCGYGRAITFMMSELRKHRTAKTPAKDSEQVDYET